jgi:hypothetical protein
VLEESEMGGDPEVNLVEMDEDGNLKNGDRVQMKQFNFDMVQEAVKEIAVVELKSPLEI